MRKSVKQFLRKSLSGILCAAMLFSGVSVPELSAYAAAYEQTQETDETLETESKAEEDAQLYYCAICLAQLLRNRLRFIYAYIIYVCILFCKRNLYGLYADLFI